MWSHYTCTVVPRFNAWILLSAMDCRSRVWTGSIPIYGAVSAQQTPLQFQQKQSSSPKWISQMDLHRHGNSRFHFVDVGGCIGHFGTIPPIKMRVYIRFHSRMGVQGQSHYV